MRYMEDPRQSRLFDVFERLLSDVAYRRLTGGWQHLFRSAILKLLPAKQLAEHFHPELGRPTKELYSMAGLVFIMEFRDWTHEEAADAYMFHNDIHYALNLEPEQQSLSARTIERYLTLFRDDDLASTIMTDVTCELVQLLELDVSKQRLDSTHVHSNMAKFGRIKFMATAIRRFLTQVKRHAEGSYRRLREPLRERYEASDKAIFGWKSLDDDEINELRQSVAEDLLYLVEYYRKNKKHNTRSTYLMLAKILEQQCNVVDNKVSLKEKPGGNIICNTSDPDATVDGHKGSGYQIQLTETCSPLNTVQLVTAAFAETAVESDSAAIEKLLTYYSDLDDQGICLYPETMYADTAYGSDNNIKKYNCTDRYVPCVTEEDETRHADYLDRCAFDLVSPVGGTKADPEPDESGYLPLTVLDFEYDEDANRFTHCPAGHELHRAHYKPRDDQHVLLMMTDVCKACDQREQCPIQRDWGSANYVLRVKTSVWLADEHTKRRPDSARRTESVAASRRPTRASNAGQAWTGCEYEAAPQCSTRCC